MTGGPSHLFSDCSPSTPGIQGQEGTRAGAGGNLIEPETFVPGVLSTVLLTRKLPFFVPSKANDVLGFTKVAVVR